MREGWEIKKLSEIGKLYNGNSINENIKKDNYTDIEDGLPFIATKDISYESEIDYDNGVRIPFLEKSSFKIAPPNTVLICAEGGSAGRKIGFTNQEVCFGNKLFALTISNNITNRYIYYYYFSTSFQKQFLLQLAGIIGGVSMNKFKDIEIPIPPPPEQQHIVAILDKAFAAIDKAKANAEQNLKNAKELFESYLQGVFESKGDDWEETCLKNEIELITGFAFKSKFYTANENDILLIRGDNIMQGDFRWIDAKRWDKEQYTLYSKYQLKENDIVLAMDRPWVKAGLKCAKISKNELPALLVQRTACLRAKKNISSTFLYLLIKSKTFTDYLLDIQTGIGVPHISGQQILDYTFYLPKIKTQQIIVQKLDVLSSETKKLETIYQKTIEDLEELKKSILQKAFSGELTEKEVSV